jgi:putative ubiquitin-RnfH superfamily antitoxin RatB of RatAB toxin-antitoxin module
MMIQVSLCFCPAPDVVEQLELQTQAGIRVRDVLQQAERDNAWLSQLQTKYPQFFEPVAIDALFDTLKLGIFSKRVSLDHVMADGDRLEIYRPLLIDPKDARRLRHKHKAQQK